MTADAHRGPNGDDPIGTSGPYLKFSPLVIILCIAAVVIGVAVLIPRLRQSQQYTSTNHPAVGRSVDLVQLEPLTSATQPIGMPELSSRVVLINFWGTWCPPCRLEMPHLVALYREMRNRADVRFVSVSCDDSREFGELAMTTQRYLERHRFADLPTYADPQGLTRRHIADVAEFGTGFAYPTTLVLDQSGIIRGIWVGIGEEGPAATVAQQRALIEELSR